MEIFKPSWAKIISLPPLFVFSFFIVTSLFGPFVTDSSFDNFFLVFPLVVAYILSCIIWTIGKNHRRLLIVIFTILNSLGVYFVCSVIAGFFGLCPTSLILPCPDNKPCNNIPPCPQSSMEIILTSLSIGLPILFLVIGIVLFIKEGKGKANKGKK